MSLPNNACADAIDLGTSLPLTVTVDTTPATNDPDTDCGSGTGYHAAWYKFTAPASHIRLKFNLDDLGAGEIVGTLYTGSCGSLVLNNCMSGGDNILDVTPATEYHILLTSFDDIPVTVTLTISVIVPTGDFCKDFSSSPTPPVTTPGAGIYKVVVGKKVDSFYTDSSAGSEATDFAIPEPSFTIAYFGE